MMRETTENEWKNEAPLLAEIKRPVLHMPGDEYFNPLHQRIMHRIEAAAEWQPEFPILAGILKPDIKVPGNEYFNSASEHITQVTTENNEWQTETSLLTAVNKPYVKMPDEAYFSSFSASVINRIRKEEAPVVSMWSAMIRYAAIAACMAGTMWLYKSLIDSSTSPTLAVHAEVYEAEYDNLPELYNADELSSYVGNDMITGTGSTPETEELHKSVGSYQEIESMQDM
jgi:glycerophosphoryl diester phosphodiesterase